MKNKTLGVSSIGFVKYMKYLETKANSEICNV